MRTAHDEGPHPLALPDSARDLVADVGRRLGGNRHLAVRFERCFTSTWRTTLRQLPDGSVFVITGDIPAMWLRDSCAQLRPYLVLAGADPHVAEVLTAAVRRLVRSVLLDPYANAFNAGPTGARWHGGDRSPGAPAGSRPWVWERKYELDSLCYPLQLADLLWRATGRTDHLDAEFRAAVDAILEVWTVEQDHEARSAYRFDRPGGPPGDRLPRRGRGTPVAPTGMTWSGFRPSDDACRYGYLVPSNMFAAVVLDRIAAMAEAALCDPALAARCRALGRRIRAGLAAHAEVEHSEYGRIWSYETDGQGAHLCMDDANVPSLLSLPYLGWCAPDDPRYLATRAFVLSPANPHYAVGRAAAGVGSPHTPPGHVWPLALAMQGLTAVDPAERERMLELLAATDDDTQQMHESFHADDPSTYTRGWFCWADALFSELVMTHCGLPTTPDGRGPATPAWSGSA